MWALSPSIFDLLSDRLVPTDPWIAECHPCVQYAILHTLYGHCCRHGNFVSSSCLLATDTVSLATMSQATSEYLTRILRLLVALLEGPKTSFDVRCLAIKWVQEVVNGLTSTSHVFVMVPCLAVIRALITQGEFLVLVESENSLLGISLSCHPAWPSSLRVSVSLG